MKKLQVLFSVVLSILLFVPQSAFAKERKVADFPLPEDYAYYQPIIDETIEAINNPDKKLSEDMNHFYLRDNKRAEVKTDDVNFALYDINGDDKKELLTILGDAVVDIYTYDNEKEKIVRLTRDQELPADSQADYQFRIYKDGKIAYNYGAEHLHRTDMVIYTMTKDGLKLEKGDHWVIETSEEPNAEVKVYRENAPDKLYKVEELEKEAGLKGDAISFDQKEPDKKKIEKSGLLYQDPDAKEAKKPAKKPEKKKEAEAPAVNDYPYAVNLWGYDTLNFFRRSANNPWIIQVKPNAGTRDFGLDDNESSVGGYLANITIENIPTMPLTAIDQDNGERTVYVNTRITVAGESNPMYAFVNNDGGISLLYPYYGGSPELKGYLEYRTR